MSVCDQSLVHAYGRGPCSTHLAALPRPPTGPTGLTSRYRSVTLPLSADIAVVEAGLCKVLTTAQYGVITGAGGVNTRLVLLAPLCELAADFWPVTRSCRQQSVTTRRFQSRLGTLMPSS